MAAVATHRFISWPPHWTKTDTSSCREDWPRDAPHPTGVVYDDWVIWPRTGLSYVLHSPIGLVTGSAIVRGRDHARRPDRVLLATSPGNSRGGAGLSSLVRGRIRRRTGRWGGVDAA